MKTTLLILVAFVLLCLLPALLVRNALNRVEKPSAGAVLINERAQIDAALRAVEGVRP